MKQTVTIRNPRHLSLRDNRLIIREKDPVSHGDTMLAQIPLSDIWVVIIDSPQITMTSALISEMNDAGIGVMYCGRDHMPNGLCLPLGAHSRHAEIVEYQLAIPKPLRNQLWKRIVVSKILNQARALELSGGNATVVARIRDYAAGVHSDDRTRREAPAAADYFAAMLPYGTRREGPMAAPLDYGYAVIRVGIAQCAVSHGWLVSRGIHHHSADNAFNLVDDMIEPFRAAVDLLVVTENILDPLTPADKAKLTAVTSVIMHIDGKECPIQVAVDVFCESLHRAIELRDADMLLTPELIGLEMESEDRMRARGRI